MVSIVKVDQIKSSDGTTEYLNAGNIKNATLDSSVTNNSGVSSGAISSNATFPAGHVIQTVSGERTTTATCSAGSTNTDPGSNWVDVLSVSITPASGTKCMIMIDAVVGTNAANGYALVRVLRDSTQLNKIDGRTYGWEAMASPDNVTTTPYSRIIYDTHGAYGSTLVTYKIQLGRQHASHNVFIGRSFTGSDNPYDSSRSTTMTIMEVQG